MLQAAVHMASPVVSLTCTFGTLFNKVNGEWSVVSKKTL